MDASWGLGSIECRLWLFGKESRDFQRVRSLFPSGPKTHAWHWNSDLDGNCVLLHRTPQTLCWKCVWWGLWCRWWGLLWSSWGISQTKRDQRVARNQNIWPTNLRFLTFWQFLFEFLLLYMWMQTVWIQKPNCLSDQPATFVHWTGNIFHHVYWYNPISQKRLEKTPMTMKDVTNMARKILQTHIWIAGLEEPQNNHSPSFKLQQATLAGEARNLLDQWATQLMNCYPNSTNTTLPSRVLHTLMPDVPLLTGSVRPSLEATS